MKTLSTLMDLAGRQAVITGGAGHIGLAAGEALVEAGASVAILDLETESCTRRAEQLNGIRGGAAVPLPCDLKDVSQIRESAARALDQLGGVDVLIHCAGYVGTTDREGWVGPFAEQSVEAWDEAMRVNLTSAFLLTQSLADSLGRTGRGSVVFVSSTQGLVAPDHAIYEGTEMSTAAAYGASKAGLNQLARYLASVLAPAVRVNVVSPGGIERGQPENFRERYEKGTPLVRMGKEEDLKGAFLYLASDLSSYVTGQNLVVDGGWTLW